MGVRNPAAPVAALMLTAALPCVAADEDENDTDGFVMPEVVVVEQTRRSTTGVLVREATRTDFRAWNAQTAGDALRWTPGVNVQVGGSSGDARAWIRGFRDRDVLILFDGIPIASPFEGTIDLNEIPIESLSRVRVIKGAPSVVYGVNGIGGVVDMLPRETQVDGHLDARAEIRTNSAHAVRGSLSDSYSNLDFMVAGSFEKSDGYRLSDDFEAHPDQPAGDRLNSDFERLNGFMRLSTDALPLGRTSLFVSTSSNERGLVPELGDADYERLTQSDRTTIGISSRLRSLPVSFKLFRNTTDVEITAYTDSSYQVVDEVERGKDYGTGGMVYSTLAYNDTSRLILSAMYVQDVYKADGVFDNFNRAEISTWTFAAEHQSVFRDRFTVAFGGLFNYFEQPLVDQSLTAFSPQVSLGFTLNDRWSLHGSAAKRTRLPKLRELYRSRYGNPDLEEQTAVNIDAGLRYSGTGGTAADLTFFSADIDGLIERFDRRSIYENLQDVEIRGFEASLFKPLRENLDARIAVILADATNVDDSGNDAQLRSRPRQTVHAELRYRPSDYWSVVANGIYVNQLYDRDPDENFVRLPSYVVANLRVGREFSNGLQAYVAVSNLADKDYQHRFGFPREGRAVQFGISYSRQ